MRLRVLGLEHFRNLDTARLYFHGTRQFLVGRNGQGKSNILEAAGYPGALRSFRTPEMAPLIHKDEDRARVLYEFDHESRGETRLEVDLAEGKKRVRLDGERVSTLSSIIGVFPVVTLHSGDIHLLDGPPGNRRQFMDLFLSMRSTEYLENLKVYNQALSGRNRLLKKNRVDQAQCEAFELLMCESGFYLHQGRMEGLVRLEKSYRSYYRKISPAPELPMLEYAPNLRINDREAYQRVLAEERPKDEILGSTRHGPHRDDFIFRIQEQPAKAFASEGQKRGLVMALRLAQTEILHQALGIRPLLLIDDVIGELDEERRNLFWEVFDPEMQVVATGTVMPTAPISGWEVYRVVDGCVTADKAEEQDD